MESLVAQSRSSSEEAFTHASLLSHPLLSSAPSTSSLSSALHSLQTDILPRCEASLNFSRSALVQELLEAQRCALEEKQELSDLPRQIEEVEDEVMTLASSMGLLDERGQQRVPGLLGRLTEQRRELMRADKTVPFVALLARAEQLKQDTLRGAEDQHGSAKAGLRALQSLSSLIGQAGQAYAGADAIDQGSTLMAYLTATRDAALRELNEKLEARLRSALEESGWPPVSAEIAEARGEAIRSASSTLESKQVKQAWQRLCRLQRVAIRAKLIGKASYDAQSDAKVGSTDYTPLAPVKVLMEPLLARFAYHFDGDKSTNRLDKPQWYVNHMSNLLRSYNSLFDARNGKVTWLCDQGGLQQVGPRELVHFVLAALRLKVLASKEQLQKKPAVLAHTVSILLSFDSELQQLFHPSSLGKAEKISDLLLGDSTTFDAWLEGERTEAQERLQEILEDKDAWLISSADMDTEAEEDLSNQTWSAISNSSSNNRSNHTSDRRGVQKTTRSARGLCQILEAISERSRPLTLLVQRLGFLAIQDDLLSTYHQRLTRSLDAFESLSGAFARALPGGIASQDSSSESDMVRGLRGSSRLLKAFLSSLYVVETLRRLSEEGHNMQLNVDLNMDTAEAKMARETRRSWTGKREEEELDGASLGELVRRGMRGGSSLRPLAAGVGARASKNASVEQVTNADEDVWQEARKRFEKVGDRASKGLVRLVTSEVTEAMREYTLRRWSSTSPPREHLPIAQGKKEAKAAMDQDEDEDEEDSPTPGLIPSLSLLETHLSHLVPVLQPSESIPIYRLVARNVSQHIVDRVIISGGSHRFDQAGALRFERDYTSGWMSVLNSLSTLAQNQVSSGQLTGLGRQPEAAWRRLRDTILLLNLSAANVDQTSSSTASSTLLSTDAREKWTLSRATRALFDEDPANHTRVWVALKQDLGIAENYDLNTAREVLRRRVECPK